MSGQETSPIRDLERRIARARGRQKALLMLDLLTLQERSDLARAWTTSTKIHVLLRELMHYRLRKSKQRVDLDDPQALLDADTSLATYLRLQSTTSRRAGGIVLRQGRISAAVAMMNEALRVAQALADRELILQASIGLAECSAADGDCQRGLAQLEIAADGRFNVTAPSAEAQCHAQRAVLLFTSGADKEASACAEEALRLTEEAKLARESLWLQHPLALGALSRKDRATALEHYKIALAFYEDAGDLHGMALCHHYLAGAYDSRDDLEAVLRHNLYALRHAARCGGSGLYARALQGLAFLLARAGDPSSALSYFSELQERQSSAQQFDAIPKTLASIATCHEQLNQPERALEAIEECIARCEERTYAQQLVSALEHKARLLRGRGQAETALALLQRGADIAATIENLHGAVRCKLELASALLDLRRYTRAEDLLRDCLNCSEDNGAEDQSAAALVKLGGLYVETGSFPRAEAMLGRSLRIADRLDDSSLQAAAYRQLADLYSAQGMMEPARDYAQRYRDHIESTIREGHRNCLMFRELRHALERREWTDEQRHLRQQIYEMRLAGQRQKLRAASVLSARQRESLRSIDRSLKQCMALADQSSEAALQAAIEQVTALLDVRESRPDGDTDLYELGDFLRKVRARYPRLSGSEAHLIGMLRLQLSNKEISLLMNVSSRSIETYRYRIRKKLGLGSEVDLKRFLIDLDASLTSSL